jgi:predicted dehydrogenase/nucleoside-diphosphate-sugar epimerase
MSKGENPSKSEIRVALFGVGKMGLHHIKAVNFQSSAKLVAIADPEADHKKLSNILQKEIPIFTSAEELLKEIKPDVAHICTPPETHTQLAKLALKHGANVYVEKPFALSTNEAKEVISLANELGLNVCAGHQVLFENPARKTAELLKKIGRIVHIESYFSFRTVRRNISPVDQLIDILPHPIYLLLYFLQAASTHNNEIPVELRAIDVGLNAEVRGIFKVGEVSGVLVVTLRGRPIESYLRIVGTNGFLYADFVRGTFIELAGPGTSTISIVLNPYIQAKQIFWETTKSFAKLAFSKQKSYPGLVKLIGTFYESILNGTSPPITTTSIIETVRICETIGRKLRDAEAESEKLAEAALKQKEFKLHPIDAGKGGVLVTGGTGFLGRVLVSKLRSNGWPVRVVARHIPPPSARIPGIEYVLADLSDEIPVKLLNGIDTIVHCAAETAGGKDAHERNTIGATRNIIEAAARAGVKKFIHISSIAVLKKSRKIGRPLDESTPIDLANEERGPYVWGKAQSERLATELSRGLGIHLRIIRPGPLIDFNDFEAPGRLGREVGSFFVAMGNRKSKLNICTVQTAAKVIHEYVENFDAVPSVLNLIEPNAPTRTELVTRLLSKRADLHVCWIPFAFLHIMSPILKILQYLIRPGRKPLDIRAAFASEKYNSDLAAKIIQEMR